MIITLLVVNVFANSKILMVTTSHDILGKSGNSTGLWLSEFVHAYNEFDNAGFEVVVSAPKAIPLPIDFTSIKLADKESLDFLTNGKKRTILNSAISLNDAKKESFDAIYLVGGHGVMWDFANNKDLKHILLKMNEERNIISGVCHGPAGLVNVKDKNGKSIIDGVKLTGFSNTEEKTIKLTSIVPFSLENELVKSGAIYSQAKKDFEEYLVIDGNFVTGQNPESARAVAKEVVRKIKAR